MQKFDPEGCTLVFRRVYNPSIMFIRFAWILSFIHLLAGCQLVVEPRYVRPGPETGGANMTDGEGIADVQSGDGQGASVDGGLLDGDVPNPVVADDVSPLADGGDGAVFDLANRCRPMARERCNFVDDNCNGMIDEMPIDVGQACLDAQGRPGTLSGLCECNPLARAEVCGNGMDDDGDGVVDNGCACDTFYASQSIPALNSGQTVFHQWTDVLGFIAGRRMPTVVCIITTPTQNCASATPISEPMTIGPDVQVVGGFIAVGGNLTRDASTVCRPTINSVVSFERSNPRSALVHVKVASIGGDRPFGVLMHTSGTIQDVIISRSSSSAGAIALGGVAPLGGAIRWLSDVTVLLGGINGAATGVSLTGGTQLINNLTVGIDGARLDVKGLQLVRSELTIVRGFTMRQGMPFQGSYSAISIEDPAGPTLIGEFRSDPTSAIPSTSGASAILAGILAVCAAGSPQPVTMIAPQWSGGASTGMQGTAIAVGNTNCNMVIANSGVATTSLAGGNGQGMIATTLAAVRCQGGSTEIVGTPGTPGTAPRRAQLFAMSERALASAETLAPIRAVLAASVSLSDVLLIPNNIMQPASATAAGVLASASELYIERTIIKPAYSAMGAGQQRGIEWQGGPRLEVRDSVISIQNGLGMLINPASILDGARGVHLISNTILRAPSALRMPNVTLIDVVGTRPPNAIFRVINNIFAPGQPIGDVAGEYATFRTTAVQPFSALSNNLVSESSPVLRFNGMAFNDSMSINSGLTPNAGPLLLLPANFAMVGDHHLSRSSPAIGAGSIPATFMRRDVDGDPRPMGLADIGADEVN